MQDPAPESPALGATRANPKGLSLRENFSWVFVGNAVYNACQWGIIVVLAKLGTPELVGRYTLALALTAPVFMFSNLNLTVVLSSDTQEKYPFGNYLGLRLLCSSLSLVPIAFSVWLGHYGAATVAAVALVSLSKYAESVSDIAYGLMQNHERLDFMARSLILKGVFSLAAFASVQFFTHDLTASLVALTAVWSALLLFYDLPRAGQWASLRPILSPRALRPLLWFALPLGVVGALASLGMQIPRYAMEHWRGERELGIFAAITALGMVARMMTLALSRSTLPRLSKQFAQGSMESFRKLTLQLVLLGAGVGLAGFLAAALFGRTILALVYTPEYAAYNDVFMVVMLYVGLVAAFTFLGTATTAAQCFRPQVTIHLLKIATIVALCVYAVPRWGALGAAWALFLGTLVSSVGYVVLLARLIREKCAGVSCLPGHPEGEI
jgi:O-antigen/teichoic acid export membrane protein